MSDKKKEAAKDTVGTVVGKGVAGSASGVGIGLLVAKEMDYRREFNALMADRKHLANMLKRKIAIYDTQQMVRKMGDRIESIQQKAIDSATKENVATKPEPSANQNQRNAGNVRSTKPPPKHPYQMSHLEMRDRKLRSLYTARDTANVLRTGVFEPTIKAIQKGNEAVVARKPVPVPKAANQNKVRTMGRGGGGWFVNPTGLLGKATEKWFKRF